MNRQCDECGGWELGDGTEDADFNPCRCDDDDPTVWCSSCQAMSPSKCKCGSIADND